MNGLMPFAALAFGMTLAGGALPLRRRELSRESLFRFLALGSGVLLSVTFLEILPRAFSTGSELAGTGLLAAFLLLFALEHYAVVHSCQEVLEDCHVHVIGVAAMAAMGLHALIDGMNLAVAFGAGKVAGWSVGLALVLHKFADGLTLTTLLRQSGYANDKTALAVTALALATPLGALAGWGWLSGLGAAEPGLLGFAAGCFLYFGTADVLPQIHRANDRACLALFALGLLGGAAGHLLH